MQLQNWVSLTIELSKPFKFGHLLVLLGGFGDVADTWQWTFHLDRPRRKSRRRGERGVRPPTAPVAHASPVWPRALPPLPLHVTPGFEVEVA